MPEATVSAVTRYGGDRTPESPNWEEPWPLSAATGRGPSGREPGTNQPPRRGGLCPVFEVRGSAAAGGPQLSVRTALASQAAGSTSDTRSHLPPPPSGAEQFMADVCGRSGGRQDAERGQAGRLEQLRY